MVKLEAKNWSVVGDLMVSFFPPGPIAHDVWQDYCDTIASEVVLRVLATSVGVVEVDVGQRKQVNLALKTPPQAVVAVVTDEAIVRGLMTATAWLGRVNVRAFPWHKVEDAHRYLAPTGIDEQATIDLVAAVRSRAEQPES